MLEICLGAIIVTLWQQQSTSYSQVCHKFFKIIRKTQCRQDFWFCPFVSTWRTNFAASIVVWYMIGHETFASDYFHSRNKTRKSNQLCCLSSMPPLDPLLPWCFTELWWGQPSLGEPTISASVWALQSFLNSGTSYSLFLVQEDILYKQYIMKLFIVGITLCIELQWNK